MTLLTCHAAKGLEFKHVYIVGVEEELLPSALSMSSADEVEEERRLLYVAMTRAKETCVMTYAKTRFRNGQTVQSRPSRFLSEIGRKFTKIETSSDYSESGSTGFMNPMDRYNSFRKSSVGSYGRSERPAPVLKKEASSSATGGMAGSNGSGADGGGLHTPDEVGVGTKIVHAKLGRGVVTKLDYVMGEGVITVRFAQAGEKKLYLRFARFSIE